MSICIDEVEEGDIVSLESEEGEVISINIEDNEIEVEVTLDSGETDIVTVDCDEPYLGIVSSGD